MIAANWRTPNKRRSKEVWKRLQAESPAVDDYRSGMANALKAKGYSLLVAEMVARYDIDAETAEILNRFIALVGTDPHLRAKWSRAITMMAADSLCAFEFGVLRTATSIADLGAGAGLPGLVVAIVRRDVPIALVEQNWHFCEFMRRAAATLELDAVEVIHGSAGDWRAGHGTRDLVVSRNAMHISVLMPWTVRLLRPTGSLVVWRGPHAPWDDEIAAREAQTHGMRFVRSVELPWIKANHCLLHFKRPPD